jgi:ATP-dependent Lon protease
MSKHDVHIHIIPSHGTEGPSAGAALLSSLVSAFAKKPYNRSYAMTGELSLTGKILPIGGLKEKLLGAKKNGVTKVIVPRANEADLFELKDITEDMEITVVSHANEVLNKVLLPPLNGK